MKPNCCPKKSSPITSNAYLGFGEFHTNERTRGSNAPLQPIAQIDHSVRISELAHPPHKQPRAGIDVRLQGRDRRHAVHNIDNPPSLALQSFVGIAEIVWVFRERLVVPNGVEARLRQSLRRRVDLTDRFGVGARDLSRLGQCGQVAPCS